MQNKKNQLAEKWDPSIGLCWHAHETVTYSYDSVLRLNGTKNRSDFVGGITNGTLYEFLLATDFLEQVKTSSNQDKQQSN
jgi:hypothetical protein